MLESIDLLASATQAFTDLCVIDMKADAAACEAGIEKSLSLVTALVPLLGYEKSAALAKEAMASGKTIRELCVEQNVLSEAELKKVLDARGMTGPKA
jgi:fumarate hydratase class II